jgi:hypothetical protein
VKHVFPIDLGQWPQACCLITDKRAYGRFMRDHGIGEARPFPPEGGGSCQTITKGECCKVIIAIGPHPDWDELAVTLSHEATHAMRWILEHVGETEPGAETQAYLVGHIVRQALKIARDQPRIVQSA